LTLNGRNAFAKTAPLPFVIREKTLEAWVTLADLGQRGGSPISLEGGDKFDAIVFGELEAKRWMVGSSYFQRTRNLEAATETASSSDLVHVAITYDSSNRIAFYRNGLLHGNAYLPEGENAALQTFTRTNAHLLFGLRHTGSKNGYFAGEIEEARLYDRALTPDQISSSFEAGPIIVTQQQLASALNPDENRTRMDLRARLAKAQAALRESREIAKVYAANPTTNDIDGPVVRKFCSLRSRWSDTAHIKL